MKQIKVAMFHGAGITLNIEKAAGVEIAEIAELHILPKYNINPSLYARWIHGPKQENMKQLKMSPPIRGHLRSFGRKERIFWDFRFWWQCRKYNILHYHSHVTGGLIAPHKSVVHIHNLDIGDWYGYPYFTPGLKKLHFIFLSKYLRNAFLQYHSKVKKKQTYVVYSGVDLDAFNNTNNQESNKIVKIIYLSQWSKNKGLFVLIKALKKLQNAGYVFRFQLAGDPGMCAVYTPKMQKEIREKVLSEIAGLKDADLLGYISHDRLPYILKKTDIVAVPSVWQEPYGIVAAEAMATGLPVIATKVGGLVESVINNDTGLIINPNDVESLTSALSLLIKDPELRIRMGQAGKKRAQRYFGWEHHARKLQKIYEHILENPGHAH